MSSTNRILGFEDEEHHISTLIQGSDGFDEESIAYGVEEQEFSQQDDFNIIQTATDIQSLMGFDGEVVNSIGEMNSNVNNNNNDDDDDDDDDDGDGAGVGGDPRTSNTMDDVHGGIQNINGTDGMAQIDPLASNLLTLSGMFMFNDHNVEIGKQAVWSLSTAKQGNGVQQLRDGDVDTFWQSDGPLPHLVNIQFHKIMRVIEVSFYLDHKLDESYTPKQISVRSGYTFNDLKEIHFIELNEPSGWISVPLNLPLLGSKDDGDGQNSDTQQPKSKSGVNTNMLQLAILSNHQNGRDCHIRQIKVYGPSLLDLGSYSIPETTSTLQSPQYASLSHYNNNNNRYKSVELSMFSSIR